MAVASGQMLSHQVSTAPQIDEPHLRPVADDDLAIGSFERRARDDARLPFGPLSIDPSRHAIEPRQTVGIRKRNACVHLGDVFFRMEQIALLESPAEPC
jgi:hypothetical protein